MKIVKYSREALLESRTSSLVDLVMRYQDALIKLGITHVAPDGSLKGGPRDHVCVEDDPEERVGANIWVHAPTLTTPTQDILGKSKEMMHESKCIVCDRTRVYQEVPISHVFPLGRRSLEEVLVPKVGDGTDLYVASDGRFFRVPVDAAEDDPAKMVDPKTVGQATRDAAEKIEGCSGLVSSFVPKEERICVECGHCEGWTRPDGTALPEHQPQPGPRCKRHRNKVDGAFLCCIRARAAGVYDGGPIQNDCGPEGKFWTPKEEIGFGLKGSCPDRRKDVRRWEDCCMYPEAKNKRVLKDRRKGGAS